MIDVVPDIELTTMEELEFTPECEHQTHHLGKRHGGEVKWFLKKHLMTCCGVWNDGSYVCDYWAKDVMTGKRRLRCGFCGEVGFTHKPSDFVHL